MNMTGELIASYLEAFGTIAAVVLALFLQVVLVRLRRPRLHVTLSLDKLDGDVAVTRAHPVESAFTVWIRLKVWNYPKKRHATNSQVFVQRLAWPDTSSVLYPFAAGSPLNWSETSADTAMIAS